jgi:hypothetical protein
LAARCFPELGYYIPCSDEIVTYDSIGFLVPENVHPTAT